MLSARGVSRASAILPSFHLKQFITFTNQVLIRKFLQCEILQRMLHRKTAFSGLTLGNKPFLDRGTVRRGIRFLFLEFAAFDPPASLREALRAGQEKLLL